MKNSNLLRSFFLLISFVILSCKQNSHSNYERNLENTQNFFNYINENDGLEKMISMLSPEIKHQSPTYDGKIRNYDERIQELSGYFNGFKNLKYEANIWLPNTDKNGNLTGGVRTYGTWTGEFVETGKNITLNSFHYYNYDDQGKVINSGDFFDASGLLYAVADEQVHVIEMTINGKNNDETIEFMKYYSKMMETREPNVLSWKFFESGGNKITLIERYLNEEAWFNHNKNVSPGGISEEDFKKFLDFFSINSITVHGSSTDNLKNTFKNLGFDVIYKPLESGFSR